MPLLAEPLTPEQSARIERNRLIALERKREFERKRSREKSEGGSAVAEVARSSGLPAAREGKGEGEGKHRQGANEGERCAKRIAHKGHDSPAARREGCEGGKAVEAKSWMAEERCGEAVEVDDGKKKDQDPDAAKNKWADNVEKRLELGTRQMYGPSTSDHQTDKIKWSGYFEMRNSEMSKRGAALRESHEGAGEVYRNLACSLKNGGSSGPHDGHVDADESKYVARNIFKGVRAYFTGHSGGISDLHLKSLVQLEGGEVSWTFSKTGCTHIICQNLSRGKAHAMLHGGGKAVTVVTPEWVTDSISQGRRLREGDYLAVKDGSNGRIDQMFSFKR